MFVYPGTCLLSRCSETAVCLIAYCIAKAVLIVSRSLPINGSVRHIIIIIIIII
jgi:hypothetical protein